MGHFLSQKCLKCPIGFAAGWSGKSGQVVAFDWIARFEKKWMSRFGVKNSKKWDIELNRCAVDGFWLLRGSRN
jgi:hypothetical protein